MTNQIPTLLPLLGAALLIASGCQGDEEDYPTNSTPWADAGENISTSVALETMLDGTGSYDPDEDDTLTYTWSFESIPEESGLTDADLTPNGGPDAATPTFVADQQGLYVIRLRVSDGELDSQSDFVHVMADIEGSLPVAVAGDDQEVVEGDTVSLDGSGSYDPLDNPLTYSWYLVSVPATSSMSSDDIDNANGELASFVPDAPGTFLLGLQVSNGTQDSVPDFIQITAESTNQCPTAVAETSGDLYSCTAIQVDASASVDPDGDDLTFDWRHLLVPFESELESHDFDDYTAATTTFFADTVGDYTLQVSVNDGECESTPFQFDISVDVRPYNDPPTAVASGTTWFSDAGECTNSGGSYWCTSCPELDITLSASASSDPDGDPLHFYWENDDGSHLADTYRPADIDDPYAEEIVATLTQAYTEYPDGVQNVYRFYVTVTDCMGDTDQYMLDVNYFCDAQLAP